MISISVKAKKYACNFKLYEKVTVIKGDSATGKSELTRQLSYSSTEVGVSNGFDLVMFPESRYNLIKESFEASKLSMKEFCSRSADLYLLSNKVYLIDDEYFVKEHLFSELIKHDKSNYFVIIERKDIPNISYSANELYTFAKSGKEHTIEKFYNYPVDISKDIDLVLVEGVGSDFHFFKKLFPNQTVINPSYFGGISSGGKDNLVTAIWNNIGYFKGKRTLILIDFSGFGNNIESLVNLSKEYNLDFVIYSKYLSFEYMLLKSNLLQDNIDDTIKKNILKYPSVEILCTERLRELTKNTLYSYSKSADKLSVCYYEDCCQNRNNRGICDKRRTPYSKGKPASLLKDTDFSVFLKYIKGGTTK